MLDVTPTHPSSSTAPRDEVTRITGEGWDRRGTVAVEYLVIVGTVALLAVPAALAVGKALVDSFAITREMLFFPVP